MDNVSLLLMVSWVVLLLATLALWSAVDNKLTAIDRRIGRMERLEQRLAEQQGLDLVRPDLEPVRAHLVGSKRERDRIAAIQKYRQITGAGLAEAKDAVDRIDRGETQ